MHDDTTNSQKQPPPPSTNPECAGDELFALLNAIAEKDEKKAVQKETARLKPPKSPDTKTKPPKSSSWGDSAKPSQPAVNSGQPSWTTVVSRKGGMTGDSHHDRDEWSSAKSSPALSSAGPGSPNTTAQSTSGSRDKRSPIHAAQSAGNTPKQRPRTPPRGPEAGRDRGGPKEKKWDKKRKGSRDRAPGGGEEEAEPTVPFNPRKSTIDANDEWWMYYDKPEGGGNMSQETFEVPGPATQPRLSCVG